MFKGKKIVFTGFRDDWLEAKLKSLDATVSNTVSKNTYMLITKNKNTSTKYLTAMKLGIPTKSVDEFKASLKMSATEKSADNFMSQNPKSYFTQWNGNLPYKVYCTTTHFLVRKNTTTRIKTGPTKYNWRYSTEIDANHKFATTLIGPMPYIKKWVGVDKNESNTNGDNLLFQIAEKTYIYVGSHIFKFKTKEPILKYASRMGSSFVPYPVGIGKTFVYLIDEHKYLSTAVVNAIINTLDEYERNPIDYPLNAYFIASGIIKSKKINVVTYELSGTKLDDGS